MLRKFFTFLGSLILLLLLIVLAVPFLFPVEEYRDDILAQISKKTGRDVRIHGDIELSLLPNIAVQLNEVEVSNPSGFMSSTMLKARRISLNMELWPLFEKRVIVDALDIEGAELFLEEAPGGQKNWEFETARLSPTASTIVANQSDNQNPPFNLNISQLRVSDAVVHFRKPDFEITASQLQLNYDVSQATLSLLLKHAGAAYQLNAETMKPEALFADTRMPLKVNVDSALLTAQLAGDLTKVNLSEGMVEPEFLGTIKAAMRGMGEVSSPKFSANKQEARFQQLSLKALDSVTASGNMTLNYANAKPMLNASLEIPELNADALMPKEKKAALSFIRSAHAAEGWSRDPISLAPLTLLNADVDLSIGALQYSDMLLKQVKTKLVLKNNTFVLPRFDAGLKGGTLKASGTLNAKGELSKEVSFENIPFQNLVQAHVKDVALQGLTKGKIAVNSYGKSLHDLVAHLHGGGHVELVDGKIIGFSLPSLFRQMLGLKEVKAVQAEPEKVTEFAKLYSAFSIDQGVVSLRESYLDSPKLKADASGKISLLEKWVDLYLVPTVLPTVERSEEAENVASSSGLMIPVKVKGAFDKIKVIPDYANALQRALKDPKSLKAFKGDAKALEDSFEPSKKVIKENWKELKDSKNPEALKNILNELDKNGLKIF